MTEQTKKEKKRVSRLDAIRCGMVRERAGRKSYRAELVSKKNEKKENALMHLAFRRFRAGDWLALLGESTDVRPG